ncbi:MAG TPA: enoyl-CoA hydratase/isomerase family protein [Anaeromyxobacter sp.]
MREIVISNPAKKNATSTATLEALARDLAAAGNAPILLTGAGDVFSAGLDLEEVASLDATRARRLLDVLEGLVEALFLHPAPTVALVNGHAIAGGCVLALCCDQRVAASNARARIGLNEVAAGLAFPPKTLAMVRTRLGEPRAEAAILGARLYDPAGAREAGLVDEVAEDARPVALARLEALSRHPREAYARAKLALRGGALDVSEPDRRRFEEEVLPRWCSEETRAAARRLLGR